MNIDEKIWKCFIISEIVFLEFKYMFYIGGLFCGFGNDFVRVIEKLF